MTYDHSDVEEELGSEFDTDPTTTQVDTLCTTAAALLASKVGSVDDSQADQKHVLYLLVMQLLEKRAWVKAGFTSSSSSPAGSASFSKAPVTWSDEIKAEIWTVYAVDLDAEQSDDVCPVYYNDGGLVDDR